MPAPNSIIRTPDGKAGDNPSFLDFGSTDGINDTSDVFNKAIASLDSGNRGKLYIPGGTYVIDGTNPINIDKSIRMYGDPGRTIIQVTGPVAAGKGIIDITAGGVVLEGITIDGGITTPTGLTYTTDFTVPTDSALINGTSIWIHGSGSGPLYDFVFDNIVITHTGGYGLLCDARDGELHRIRLLNSSFLNNRPHLFGTSSGDQNYGSWTGGFLILGDGTSSMCHDVLVQGNRWKCNTGNACWVGWAPAVTYLHTNVRVIGNKFEDNGLDAIETGAVSNVVVSNNTGRRIGYISTSDDTIGTPKWLPNLNATWIDTSGVTVNGSYTDNTSVSVNGGHMSLDGFSGTVSGNTMRRPGSSDPEYTIDSIASAGPSSDGQNWEQGPSTANTNDTDQGANGVTITNNTLVNLGGGAINLFAARNCTATGNNILHPADAQSVPIQIANVASGTNQRADNNVVTGNAITWNPGSPAPMVFENANGTAFLGTQINYVYNNTVAPNTMIEFQKDADSGSSSAFTFSTVFPGATIASTHQLQREGKASDSTSALKFYLVENGTAYQHAQLQGYWSSGNRGPLLNVSEAATGGVLATGARASSAFTDAIVTGKGYFDAFVVLTDTTYADVDADLLDDTNALLRFKSSVGYIEQSITTSSGSRVWAPLIASTGTAAGGDKQVQYNASGTFGADANLQWDYTNQVLTATAVDAAHAGIACATGFIQSDVGFYSANVNSDTVNIPNGGVTAKSLVSIRNDGASSVTIARTSSTARTWGFGVATNGHLQLNDDTASALRLDVDPSGLFDFGGGNVQIDQSGNISFTGIAQSNGSSAGFNATGTTQFNSIQTSGGMYAVGDFVADDAFMPKGHASTGSLNTPGAGYGGLSYHSGSTYYFYDGSAWQAIDLAAAASGTTTPGGSDEDVQYNNSGAFGGSNNFTWDNAAQLLSVTAASSGVAGINCTTGFIQSDAGFYSTGSSSSTVNIPNGGVTALSLISIRNDGASGVTIARTSSTARTWGFGVASNGHLQLNDDTAAAHRLDIDTSGQFSLGAGNTLLDQSGNISFTGVAHASGSGAGFNSTGNTAYNSIQSAGGVYAVGGFTSDQPFYPKGYSSSGSLSNPGAGYGALSYKSGSQYWFWNGSAFASIDFASVAGNNPGGSNTQVQYNAAGAFAGSANFTWNNSSQLLNVTALNSSSAGINVTTGFIQSDAGFFCNGSASTTFNAPNGGVTALSLISVRNDGSNGLTLSRTSSTARNWGFAVASDGSLQVNDATASATRIKINTSGLVSLGAGATQLDQSGNITVTGVYQSTGSSAGFNATSTTAFNSIQTSGGMYAVAGFTSDQSFYPKSYASSASLTSPGAGYGAIAYATGSTYWFWNGSAFISVNMASIGGGGAPGGSSGNVQYNSSGTFAGSGNFSWNNGSQLLTVTAASTSSAGILCSGGFIQSDYGFLATSGTATNYNAIQAPGGGMFAKSFTAINYVNSGTSAGTPTATTGDSLNNGCIYYDTVASALKAKVAGSFQNVLVGTTFVSSVSAGTGINLSASTGAVTITNTGVTSNFSGTGISVSANTGSVTISNTGVTSLSAGTGVTLSGSTGGVTVSIGQSVATSASVTFSTVNITSSAFGALTVTGAINGSGGFVTSNFASNAIQATNGGIFSSLGYNTGASGVYDVNGTVVINSSGVFVGNGVNTPNFGHAAAGFNPFVGGIQWFGTTNTLTFNDQFGTSHTIVVKGGIVTSIS